MRKRIYQIDFEDKPSIRVYVNRPISFFSFVRNYLSPLQKNSGKRINGVFECGMVEKEVAQNSYPEILMDGTILPVGEARP